MMDDHVPPGHCPTELSTVRSLLAELDVDLLEQHLGRLEDTYLLRFDANAIAQHVHCLAQLSAENPVEALLDDLGDRSVRCTVLAFDYPFEFSLITGLLAGTGFNIEHGDVFTLGRPAQTRPQQGPRRESRPKPPPRDGFSQPVIVDCFTGRYAATDSFDDWAGRFTSSIEKVIGLLEKGDEQSLKRAQHRVNQLVTSQLAKLETTVVAMPFVQIDIDQVDSSRTRLRIVGQDTPAFLYSLSTALSLYGLSILHLQIRGDGDRVEDEVHVVDADHQPILDEAMLERVRLSVLLTKRFTYFLSSSPDPVAALTRFGRLTEDIMRKPERSQWVELLRNPRTMEGLARLLGTSDFLWEDFIRAQYEALLPVLQPYIEGRPFGHRAETMPLRMQQALDGATTLAEQQAKLNSFKDDEIFLIDLEHILVPGVDFRELSSRLTWLAESFVANAARLVHEDLVDKFGKPMTKAGDEATYAIFGLGKLGGVALGYASDIELLFVYSNSGQTTGGLRDPIDNAQFFIRLAKETAQSMKTKREGIFEIDLRLRPYGKEGPVACSLKQFRKYYAPDGPAHPFERLALVRMRWIAGDPSLGFDVEQARDQFIYDQPEFDMDALWETWAKQRNQRTRHNELNAKYSPGSLVDLEGTVQLLQVMHASHVPELRAARLSVAMGGLRRAGVLTPAEYADLMGAYYFLRRLINALRMLRGNAADLFLPPADSDELTYLARRMGYETEGDKSPAQRLLDEFHFRTAAIAASMKKHFHRPCPGT